MGALDSLLGSLNSLAGTVENTPTSLDAILPGDPSTVTRFGALGDFANEIDQTAQRQYIETGYIRNVRPKLSQVLLQEPDVTVLVKKRMFSSLAENYKPELMDAKEKLFYRASKKLFANKCNAIAAYEQLSKMDRLISENGLLSSYFLPAALAGLDFLSQNGVSFGGQTQSTMDTLRQVYAFSDPNYLTTWLTDTSLPASGDLGDGTGVMELTNVASFNCSSSVNFGGGSASLTFEDPYNLMTITEQDIEKAIRETAGGFLQSAFFQLTQSQLENTVTNLRTQLNSLRQSRGATEIRFNVDPDSILYKKVTAIIDEEGREILFNYSGGLAGLGSSVDLDASATEGVNGLDPDNGEVDNFKQIIGDIYLLISLQQQTENVSFTFNSDTNHVRRKMVLHYHRKSIIQPMDIIHIFVSTKSGVDEKIASALPNTFNGNTVLDDLNTTFNTVANTVNNLSAAFGGNQVNASWTIAERDAVAGPDFPMWLWNLVRNDFTRQAAGTHVFAGIVTRPDRRYSGSDGKHILTVSAVDHCGYFKQGQININPSVDVFNGSLYDPLTPRELNFDSATGFLSDEQPPLLQENVQLLDSGLLKFKNGRFRGYPANSQIYNSFDIETIKNSSDRTLFRRKFDDPDGLIYRWKEGIYALTLLSEPHPTGELPGDSSPNLTKDPFAGQDVMNVLSLLVTGQPYNFNNFMRASISSGAFSRDDLLNEASSKSFLRGLLGDVSKQNSIWGNFLPFKKLIINQSAYNFLASGQYDLTVANTKINDLLKQRAELFDNLTKVAPAFANNPQALNVDASGKLVNASAAISSASASIVANVDPAAITSLSSNIIQLDFKIQQAQSAFQQSVTSTTTANGTLQIFGDDISFDPTINQNPSGLSQDDLLKQQQQFQNQLFYLTQRRLWKVKANEDTNYFIVDDQYDKNYDIAAFEQGLADGLQLFKSTYTDIASKIQTVAMLLGLEVYADSQGHIQARPPQYNKMPSSVYQKMLQTQSQTGVQLFPAYLENLFTNQIQGLVQQIEIAEDEMRIYTAALGQTTDQGAKKLLSGLVTGGGSTSFAFTTDESTGSFGGKDIRVFLAQVDPDLTGSDLSTALKSVGSALQTLQATTQQAISSGVNFDVVQRVSVVNGDQFDTVVFQSSTQAAIDNRITTIGTRLRFKTGQTPPTRLSLLPNSSSTVVSQLDVFNITQQIAQFISQRQSALRLLSNAIKNLSDGVALNTSLNSQSSGTSLLSSFTNQPVSTPEILQHMIEDETVDDLGYGSGARYTIYDYQIINYQISEVAPEHTMVEVVGLFAQGLAEPPGGFDTGGGNPISTAWAVDYDMWRMYGFKTPQTVQAPFLSDPDSQCAPYAVSLLNKARKEIHQAECTIAGNEFIQPGEVYYIEDEDMLFYSDTVSHSFTYGGQYTTSLSLKYGHAPGEYIPTILDIIGKGLYTSTSQNNLSRNNRHGNSNGDVFVATLVIDSGVDGDFQNLVSGQYGDQNRKNLANVLLATSGALAPTTFGQQATLEIRTYFDSKGGFNENGALSDIADSVRNWLINPVKVNLTSTSGDLTPDNDASVLNMVINPKSVVTAAIDLSDDTDPRSPSAGAINKAKEVAATSGFPLPTAPAGDPDQLDPKVRPTVFNMIIDIWVTFNSVSQTNQITKSPDQVASQAAQTQLAQTLADFNAKVKSQTGS